LQIATNRQGIMSEHSNLHQHSREYNKPCKNITLPYIHVFVKTCYIASNSYGSKKKKEEFILPSITKNIFKPLRE